MVVVIIVIFTTSKKEIILCDENGNQITKYEQGGSDPSTNRLGYDFLGWVDKSTGKVYDNLDAAIDDGVTQLNQQWSLKEYTLTLYVGDYGMINGVGNAYIKHDAVDSRGPFYTMSFNIESGDIKLPSTSLFSGYTISSDRYSFRYWSQINSDIDDPSRIVDKITKGTTRNVTLYAIWDEHPCYLYIYGKDNTSIFDPILLSYDDVIEKLWNDPTLAGYDFGGYYSDINRTVPYVFGENKIKTNVVIYTKWSPREYKITYKDLNGNVLDTLTFNMDSLIQHYDYSSRLAIGKELKGWSTKPNDASSIFSSTKMVAKDLELYPIIQEKNYTIKWNINGKVENDSYTYNQTPSYKGNSSNLIKNSDAQYDYTFTGWKTANGNDIAKVTEDVEYIAQYSNAIRSYTYNFTVDGVLYENQTGKVDYGTEINVPTINPTKPSTAKYTYTFDGWYLNNQKVNNTVTVVGPSNLEARFNENINKYTVEWWGRIPEELIYSREYEYGTTISADSFDGVNYTDVEVDIDVDGVTKYFKGWDIDSSELIDNLVIHAQYAERSYVVEYYVDGRLYKKNFCEINKHPVFPTKPTKDSDGMYTYEFKYWYETDSSIECGADDVLANEDETVRLYGYFEATPIEYQLILKDGDENINTISVDYGSDLQTVLSSITTPEKTGYTFDTWKDVPETMPANNLELQAQWNIKQYTISFVTNGGTNIESITEDYDATLVRPNDPEKEGYSFAGWDIDFPARMPANDLVLTAQWSIEQYTITLNINGDVSVELITQDYGSEIEIPADPSKTGYSFVRWDKEIPTTMPAEDVEINAVWQVNQYTITFNTDGGSVIESITQDYGSEIEIPSNPEKTGYSFAGWDRGIPATMPAEDVEITASWTINRYNIIFNTNGGNEMNSVSVEYNAAMPVIEAPEKEGYDFAGWDIELPEKMPAEDITLTAQWSPKTFVVTFDTAGSGVVLDSINVTYGSTYGELYQPVWQHHVFECWKDEDGNIIDENSVMIIAKNHTLKAEWSLKKYYVTYENNIDIGISIPKTEFTIESNITLYNSENDKYELDGWYEDESITTRVESYSAGEKTEDFVVYGNWYTKGLGFTLNGSEYTVTKYTGTNDNVYIPEKCNGKNVTSIADYAFQYNDTIVKVVANSIKNIGTESFSDCGNLQEVEIDSVETIGAKAFSYSNSLKNVHMNNVVTISEGVFAGCTSLENIYISDSLTTIGLNAFRKVDTLNIYYSGEFDLENVTIGEGNSVFNQENLIINN